MVNLVTMSFCGAFCSTVLTMAGEVAMMSAWPLTAAVTRVASSSKRTICASLAPVVTTLSLFEPRVVATRLPLRSSKPLMFTPLGPATTARIWA
ncbi:hypothetical protein D3C71_1847900 [compost metagenome]